MQPDSGRRGRRARIRALGAPTLALTLACWLSHPATASARETVDKPGLFGPRDTLSLRIEAPWGELTRRPESGRSRDGRLTYTSPTGDAVILDVRVTTRGKSRLEICALPMLTLELDADGIAGTLFERDPVVHLTLQCQPQPSYLRYLVLEHLAYRAFAMLADHSLRTRWLSVEYADPGGKRRPRPAHAFLVEDIGLAAARLGLEWRQPGSVDLSALDADARALFALFQFMIGNTDWSLRAGPRGEPCCHNVAVLGPPDRASGWLPVPFDLDNAGLVDAEYAIPDRRLGVRSTRQRVYRGHCDLDPHLEAALSRFVQFREGIEALFADSEHLARRSKSRALKYLATFFEIVDDPEKLARQVRDRCR